MRDLAAAIGLVFAIESVADGAVRCTLKSGHS
jgi:hypothetical protein